VSGIERLLEIMSRLRDPDGGCPWDVEQTFETIAPYTIEEAYEVDDAIRRRDLEELREELGDLLLQVVFHAQMAREAGAFRFDDVVDAVCDKLVRRHPNVFGEEAKIDSAAAQLEAWEAHKANEREGAAEREGRAASVLDGVPLGLPALLRSRKLLRRAARAGFEWPGPGDALEKVAEEVAEVRAEVKAGDRGRLHHELGDLLIAAAGLAQVLDLDPEAALRDANARFERRLRHVEARLAGEGRTLRDAGLAELLEHWRRAKREDPSSW
jgi:MazG family protein